MARRGSVKDDSAWSHVCRGFWPCPPPKMRKTLIVRTCAVGDFVVNLPALIALQQMHPAARFTLAGNPSTLALAKEFIAVDSIVSIDAQPWSQLFYQPIAGLEFDHAIV